MCEPLIHIYLAPPKVGDIALCGWVKKDDMESYRLHTSTNQCADCERIADEMNLPTLKRVPTDPEGTWRKAK